MLDADTKRRIDTARDILVGKVPDPKSQVEQITIALIYKFMDDIDAESEELGGKRTFFADGFARYGWAKLMSPGIGGHETLNLYAEAITKMPENPGIPQLFREIFNNAYLPYRDPETLRAFLKVIDGFAYDHSESLGDAFEYLLSVLGAQGDAGQFRTPRHIIDFMVSIVDPKKDEVILDPACGTAGFLISSYKHILASNTRADGSSTLTPDDRGRMASNFKGYDISPDMVRLSLANLYLHGFAAPQVYEYDTLTSDERWNEFADVILANPPFMSPKGGIRPHNRFSIQSKRSEVLFVDYMAEHLTANGRAGVIVPEGIIFQSQNAHKRLRKMLLDTCLVAVVSLPAGVFKPYSGVKTSILILDKSLGRKTDSVAFFKVENDGFDLGDQRRPIDANDLPQTACAVREWLDGLRSAQGAMVREKNATYTAGPVKHGTTDLQLLMERGAALQASKAKIAADGECNLSGERYRDVRANTRQKGLMVALGDTKLFRIESGGTPKSTVSGYWNGGVPWITLVDLPSVDSVTNIRSTERTISEEGLRKSSAVLLPKNSVVVSTRATIGRIAINRIPLATNQGFKNVVIEDHSRAIPEYVAIVLLGLVPTMQMQASGATYKELTKTRFSSLQIPLPPLPVQREIVEEIEGYQRVIDGARGVVENYRPRIVVDLEWPMVMLKELCDVRDGTHESPQYVLQGYPLITSRNLKHGFVDFAEAHLISRDDLDSINRRSRVDTGDILMPMIGTIGNPVIADTTREYAVKNVALIKFKEGSKIMNHFLKQVLSSSDMQSHFDKKASGSSQKFIPLWFIRSLPIPVPPLDMQQVIVAELEAEQEIVNANRDLIARFEKKIEEVVSRVWGASSAV